MFQHIAYAQMRKTFKDVRKQFMDEEFQSEGFSN